MPHQCLLGNLPGFVPRTTIYPREAISGRPPIGRTGGLMDALLPAAAFGQPIVGYRGRFDRACARADGEVWRAQLVPVPTALKLMMKAFPRPRGVRRQPAQRHERRGGGRRRVRMGAGRARRHVNEMFGQTEMNYIVGNSHTLGGESGSMGRPTPDTTSPWSTTTAVVAGRGRRCRRQPGRAGRQSRSGLLHQYFRNPEHGAKFVGDWCRTGDLAKRDADGYLWYQGRADGMFKAAGYKLVRRRSRTVS
jgi:acetyl-CoA synthetase